MRSEEKQRKAEVGILGPVIRAQIRDVIKVRVRLTTYFQTEVISVLTICSH